MSTDKSNELMRKVPQVDAVLMDPALREPQEAYRHDVVVRLVREELSRIRKRLQDGKQTDAPSAAAVAKAVVGRLEMLSKPLMKPTVNAAGIVLHTNLGRALLCESAQVAVQSVARAYSNLELDLWTGKRTRRDITLEPLLHALTGCEASTVVNNNSAAVFLTLSALAQGGEVITSRGELVEIGGSYRVPDVVRSAGCTLVEVGTTNHTRLSDYENAITENTRLLLKTHTSNYKVIGFTEETGIDELVALGKKHSIPVYVDLGSGYFSPESGEGLCEDDVLEVLDAGPDLVSISGDKLLGGPQAGIVMGTPEMILKLRKNPMWRALRIDKLTVAALGATIAEHLKLRSGEPELTRSNHIAATLDDQKRLAQRLRRRLAEARPEWKFEVGDGIGFYGGGSLPEEKLAAKVVTVESPDMSADEIDEKLRRGDPPVVGYALGGVFALNVLTLLPGDVEIIIGRIAEL